MEPHVVLLTKTMTNESTVQDNSNVVLSVTEQDKTDIKGDELRVIKDADSRNVHDFEALSLVPEKDASIVEINRNVNDLKVAAKDGLPEASSHSIKIPGIEPVSMQDQLSASEESFSLHDVSLAASESLQANLLTNALKGSSDISSPAGNHVRVKSEDNDVIPDEEKCSNTTSGEFLRGDKGDTAVQKENGVALEESDVSVKINSTQMQQIDSKQELGTSSDALITAATEIDMSVLNSTHESVCASSQNASDICSAETNFSPAEANVSPAESNVSPAETNVSPKSTTASLQCTDVSIPETSAYSSASEVGLSSPEIGASSDCRSNEPAQKSIISPCENSGVLPESSSRSDSVTMSSSETSVYAEESATSSQSTDTCALTTSTSSSVSDIKLESCELDLVCDNDSESASSSSQSRVASVLDMDPNSQTSTPAKKILKKKKGRPKRFSLDSNNGAAGSSVKDEWLKPFEQGWRRELVYRKELDNNGVRPADIYYYAPNGKKLRSMPEICQYLKEKKYLIDINCFTFSKLTISKEPHETARIAGEHRRGFKQPTESPTLPVKRPQPETVTLPAPKKFKKDLPTMKIVSAQLKNLKATLREQQKTLKRPADTPAPVPEKRIKLSSSKETSQKLCGWSCPGLEGMPPTLPCDVCMCMFHPSCVKFTGDGQSFKCLACGITQTSTSSVSKTAAVLSSASPKIPSLRIIKTVSTRPWTDSSNNRILPSSEKSCRPTLQGIRAPPPLVMAPTQNQPVVLPLNPAVPACVPAAGSVFSVVVPTLNSSIGATQANACATSVLPAGNRLSLLQQPVVASQAGAKHLKLMLAPRIISQIDTRRALALKINGQSLLLQPQDFIPTSDGIKIMLPDSAKSSTNSVAVTKSSINSAFTQSVVNSALKRSVGKAAITNSATISAATKRSINSAITDSTVSSALTILKNVVAPMKPKRPLNTGDQQVYVIEPDVPEKETSKPTEGFGPVQKVSDVPSSLSEISQATSESSKGMTCDPMTQSEPHESAIVPSSDTWMPTVVFVESERVEVVESAQTTSNASAPIVKETTSPEKGYAQTSAASNPVVIPLDSDSDAESCEIVKTSSSSTVQTSIEATSSSANASVSVAPAVPNLESQDSTSTAVSSASVSVSSPASESVSSSALCTVTPSTKKPDAIESSSLVPTTQLSEQSPALDSVSLAVRDSPSATVGKPGESTVSESNSCQPRRKTVARTTALKGFGLMHAGLDSMLKIFGYLGVCDLLRIAAVCKTWNWVSKHPDLWKCVRLRGCYVNNWQRAAARMQQMNTQLLDMKSIVLRGEGSATWQEVIDHLPQMHSLQSVDFGQCPSKVIHAAAEKLTVLKNFHAEICDQSTSDSAVEQVSVVDLALFARLSHLECLKLRGVSGIQFPVYADSCELQNLSQLTQLQRLSLTTLKGVKSRDLSFIRDLSGLKILELGSCLHWNKEMFNCLSNLVNLNTLRLESGGEIVDVGLGDALKKMTKLQHLELVRYFVADNLAIVFPTLSHLKTFLIWPEINEKEIQVGRQNSIVLSAVSGMTFLQKLFWGIVHENRPQGELPTPSNRQPTIPFLLRGSAGQASDPLTLATRYLTINEIISALSDRLPDTQIQVFPVRSQDRRNT